jgi:threonine dehydrogenase-like Zn-dependent dehydrogenase
MPRRFRCASSPLSRPSTASSESATRSTFPAAGVASVISPCKWRRVPWGAGLVVSSGSSPQSIALARQSGAHHVFDYKRDDVAAKIAELTGGQGVDLVFDATYSEAGFIETARTVRRGGRWVVLGVGPGKTTRLVETHSPVDSILAERGAKHVNINLLRYFSEPDTLDGEAKTFLERGMALAMEWATHQLVVPHISQTIGSTVEAINAGLQSLKAGRGVLGKVAVIVDRNLAEEK